MVDCRFVEGIMPGRLSLCRRYNAESVHAGLSCPNKKRSYIMLTYFVFFLCFRSVGSHLCFEFLVLKASEVGVRSSGHSGVFRTSVLPAVCATRQKHQFSSCRPNNGDRQGKYKKTTMDTVIIIKGSR